MNSPATERELGALALAFVEDRQDLAPAEQNYADSKLDLSDKQLREVHDAIVRGEDPLGVAFCRLRSPSQRRKAGAVYTPQAIIESMVRWATDSGTPDRVVDPGAGSGRFLFAAGRAFATASLVAVEIDPLATLLIRANAAVLGMVDRLTVVLGDYRSAQLPEIDGSTLYIGNPPYVRHHAIDVSWKSWLASSAADYGFKASKLAGMHVHFFMRTRQLARPGDFGAFITSSEWLDVNYGAVVRRLLLDGLGGVSLQVVDPQEKTFADAITTSAIACFQVGARRDCMQLRQVKAASELGALREGREISIPRLETSHRWTTLLRIGPRSVRQGRIELGEICRVHRGQVTGCNSVWIADRFPGELPESVLFATVTKARELLSAAPRLSTASQLRRVVDLPVNLDELDERMHEQVRRFLAWARVMGANESYIARNRRAWWAVGLKAPAPVLCTYMARRPPAFVRNLCRARHLNIAHGLYPRDPLSGAVLDTLTDWLQQRVRICDGRTYAGGLTKFEPKELERILVPPLEELHDRAKEMVSPRVGKRFGGSEGPSSKAASGGAASNLRKVFSEVQAGLP